MIPITSHRQSPCSSQHFICCCCTDFTYWQARSYPTFWQTWVHSHISPYGMLTIDLWRIPRTFYILVWLVNGISDDIKTWGCKTSRTLLWSIMNRKCIPDKLRQGFTDREIKSIRLTQWNQTSQGYLTGIICVVHQWLRRKPVARVLGQRCQRQRCTFELKCIVFKTVQVDLETGPIHCLFCIVHINVNVRKQLGRFRQGDVCEVQFSNVRNAQECIWGVVPSSNFNFS